MLRGSEFHVGLKQTGNDVFVAWSTTSQSYKLDDSVTQEQLKNAYCPEDYFVYNG